MTNTELTAAATRILTAYADLAQYHDARAVRLAELREDAGLSRPDFDTAIVELITTRASYAVPGANQKILTAADWSASIHIGGQDVHFFGTNDHR